MADLSKNFVTGEAGGRMMVRPASITSNVHHKYTHN
jgi:hypothetical protein